MMKSSISMIVALSFLVIWGAGCGQTFYPDALSLTLEEINAISDDESLEPQEKRELLAAGGLSESSINGLLASERLGNQYGGDLESAYGKVVSGEMTTLTPDEVQYYGDASKITTYTDPEASAIVEFFEENDIDTTDELSDWLGDYSEFLPEDIDETNLRGVFIDTEKTDISDQL